MYTNANLLEYYNKKNGTNLTSLTVGQVYTMNCIAYLYELIPNSSQAFYWTDALIDVYANGNNYVSFPYIISDSLPSFDEDKSINNSQVSFKISNVIQSVRNLALGGYYKDARVNISMVVLDPYDSTVITTALMFSGYVDYFEAVANPFDMKAEMTCYCNSIFKKLDDQPRLIAANGVYQSIYKGDEYFSLLGQTNQNQIWKY